VKRQDTKREHNDEDTTVLRSRNVPSMSNNDQLCVGWRDNQGLLLILNWHTRGLACLVLVDLLYTCRPRRRTQRCLVVGCRHSYRPLRIEVDGRSMDAEDVVEALRPRIEIRKRPAEACRHNKKSEL